MTKQGDRIVSASRKSHLASYLIILVLLLTVVKEYFNPAAFYAIQDVLQKKPGPFRVRWQGDFGLELRAATSPHNGKIAGLQKGLILTYRGRPIIGDGYGFGLPIVHVRGTPYLAATAKIGKFVRGDTLILSKVYSLDRRELDSEIPRFQYERTGAIGSVRVDYFIHKGAIDVVADFRGLAKVKHEEIFLMNEQAGRQFRYAMTPQIPRIDLLEWQAWRSDAVGLVAPGLDATVWITADFMWTKFLGREILSRWKWYGHAAVDWAGCSILIDKPIRKFHYSIQLQTPDSPQS